MPEGLSRLLESAPLAWSLPATFLAFAVLLIVVWSVPRASVMAGASDGARWRDLRIWATLLVIVQLATYLLLT